MGIMYIRWWTTFTWRDALATIVIYTWRDALVVMVIYTWRGVLVIIVVMSQETLIIIKTQQIKGHHYSLKDTRKSIDSANEFIITYTKKNIIITAIKWKFSLLVKLNSYSICHKQPRGIIITVLFSISSIRARFM